MFHLDLLSLLGIWTESERQQVVWYRAGEETGGLDVQARQGRICYRAGEETAAQDMQERRGVKIYISWLESSSMCS